MRHVDMSTSEQVARVQAWAERLRTKQRQLVAESRPGPSAKPEPEKVDGAFDFDLLETNVTTAPPEELSTDVVVPPQRT